MLVIHHLSISQSERILWLCEELGLPYKMVKHTRDPITAPESLKSVLGNETGKSPFLEDPDAGITLSESGAICEYIINRYGHGKLSIAPSEKDYPDYLHWFHYANASLQPALICAMFVNMVKDVSSSDPAKQFAEHRLTAPLQLIDSRLKDNKWLAGEDLTAADIMTVYTLTTQRYWGPPISLAPYPNIVRYLRDCAARPAYQRAMEKGDPEMRPLIDAEPPAEGLLTAGGVNSSHWKK